MMSGGAANIVETPLAKVRDQIARACAEARRNPASVTLVAVAKTFGADAIEPVIAAGEGIAPLRKRATGSSLTAGGLPEEPTAFVRACREHCGLAIAGLMCLPPA